MSAELPPRHRQALERLVERGTLTSEQADAVRAELTAEPAPQRAGGVWEVLGYAGGALVIGGASLLVGMSWEVLSTAARIGLLVAATAVLVVAGGLIAGGPRGARELAADAPSRRSRIVSALLALASGSAAMAVVAGLDGSDSSLSASGLGLVAAAAGYALLPAVPGLVATGAFAFWFALALADELPGSGSVPQMLVLIVLGGLWAVLAVRGVLDRPTRGRAGRVRRDVGFGIAAATALTGAQWTVIAHQSWSYAITFVLAVGCFAAFVALRSAVLLVFGVLGVTVAVPEALYHWTGGALGGPLIVLLVGVVLLAAGGFGLRLRNRVG
ncbi:MULTISPECIES: DUF2157 domain-containing protein [unclassified Saccharopolyspora]|uniref:DUF2157 domain-containing protein n=1 Tax=unclassified Saccharopolyspora TaxID=2646250 RepID=UPI001CD56C39|nr:MULTISPECIES: hypothetical protein [unclassified Saccharopolyspora]MCA1193880.1 hypothetical protein [Saccharopolyspora sp. 6V]MCA1281106.1 hypothetical protein [Saccharopolyspora sp. 7B]